MEYLNAALSAVALTLVAFPSFKKMQSCSYYLQRGYFKIVLSNYFFTLCFLQIALFFLEWTQWEFVIYIEIALTLFLGVFFLCVRQKTKLKFTKRIVRLIFAMFLLCFGLCILVPFFVLPVFVPIVFSVAAFLSTMPIELSVNGYYLKKAKKKLKAASFTKIAVVGSFGKTSVKQILQQFLPDAAASPNSCNTPMGICKFVNNSDLTVAKFVIFEMGARKKGDIKELCDLVKPDCAVFLGVTAQHLETFKTFENIVKTKQEILEQLPSGSFAVLNGNNEIAKNSRQVGKCRKIVAGDSGNFEVKLISADKTGSRFELTVDGKVCELSTSLLGKAHIENVSLCAAAAIELGVGLEDIFSKMKHLKQIPHRMEIIKGAVTVIDDGYNANIDGVKLCCETLKVLNGKKIVVAQGIVEGGNRQAELNLEAGRLLGQCCDVVILCGVNSENLKKGAAEFCQTVETAADLQSAVNVAEKFYTENTFVIFQNDIP